jgi:ammonium transporter Rh
MPAEVAAKTQGTAIPVTHGQGNLRFAQVGIVIQIILIILYGVATEYHDKGGDASNPDGGMQFYYPVFQDVHVMILVGFGFLMTFLAKYGFSAVGFNFMITAFVIQWAILTNGFWHNVYKYEGKGFEKKIGLDITSLITGDFATGAVLITFGALLGKVSPLQLLTIAFIECIVFGANETIGAYELGAVDMGGSIFVHTFGAYFGLAAAWAIGGKRAKDHKDNTSSKTSDTFAMIGTLFLWMFWPSFNGALASGSQQHRVVINTVLSLCASAMAAFLFSALLRKHHKFDMVDIQNATLAGGVAVGSSSDLVIEPWGALVIGFCAGMLSVVGYVYISPWLERKIGLHDTCGVHNLHGMPGVMGALGGAFSAAAAGTDSYGESIGDIFGKRAPYGGSEAAAVEANVCTKMLSSGEAPERWDCSDVELGLTAGGQAARQVFALLVTLCFAVIGGLMAGFIAKQEFFQPPRVLFDDSVYWECPDEEEDSNPAPIAAPLAAPAKLGELRDVKVPISK